MDQHREQWPLRTMCRVLKLSRSGYYAWRGRSTSSRARRREQLSAIVREVHSNSRRTYGSPRVHAALVRDGVTCCVNTVARIMREDGLRPRVRRKYKVTTDSSHRLPVAQNVLGRDFVRRRPNEVWVADITYIPTDEGWLYLATELDLHSRRIVGWAMSERMTSQLVIDALTVAIERRHPPAGLMHRSDRGSQYASHAFQALLVAHRMVCSMSRKADVYDNAVMESFYGTLKTELVNAARYATRQEAKQAIFEWIEVFYNRQRLHSSLGYQTPADFAPAA